MTNETKMKTGAQLLVDALEKQEVEMIFGYPGGAVLPLYDAFYDSDIPHILTRHEQGAVHAKRRVCSSNRETWCCRCN